MRKLKSLVKSLKTSFKIIYTKKELINSSICKQPLSLLSAHKELNKNLK